MSVLPAGQSLLRFIPDLDDLLYDPAAYLKAAPVSIGPRRLWGLALLFLVPGIALITWAFADPQDGLWASFGERLAMGFGLAVGGMVWLGWSLLLHGHELVLHPEGVEVKYRGSAVWCPWALFNAEGEPFVPQSDSPMLGLALPINPEALPYLELRQNDAPLAHGAQVKAPQVVLSGRDAVVLPARYEVKADELGDLLLRLGRRLGRNLPRGTPTPEALGLDQVEEEPTLSPSGWFTAHLTRLRFPPHCCRCGQPTDESLGFSVEAGGGWYLLNIFAASVNPVTVTVPVCPSCQEALAVAHARATGRGALLGGLLTAAVAVFFAMQQPGFEPRYLLLVALSALSFGGLVGMLLGGWLGRNDPVQLRRFSPSRGTLALRFRNLDYAEQVLELMRKEKTRR